MADGEFSDLEGVPLLILEAGDGSTIAFYTSGTTVRRTIVQNGTSNAAPAAQ